MKQINKHNPAPPRLDTYIKEGDYVLVSNYHREKERDENVRMARFLGEMTREPVYVLPHIQPTLKNADLLRKELLPSGVKKNKNPDFYYKGRFVDGKSITVYDLKEADRAKRNIQKKIKVGLKQADDILLEIPESYPLSWINNAVQGELNSLSHNHIIYVKYCDKLLIFKK